VGFVSVKNTASQALYGIKEVSVPSVGFVSVEDHIGVDKPDGTPFQYPQWILPE